MGEGVDGGMDGVLGRGVLWVHVGDSSSFGWDVRFIGLCKVCKVYELCKEL